VARSRDDRPEYVVELEVEGVAVLSVRADSPSDAYSQAEERCRPADVTELVSVSGVRCVQVGDTPDQAHEAGSSPAPRSPSKGRERGRQT
jgi:hypothetical protein